jgi:general secretion pathway protein C
MTAGRLWLLTLLVGLGLLASLAFAGLRLSWHLAGHTNVMPLNVAAPPADQADDAPRDINAILALAPFGQPVTAEQPSSTSAAPVSVDVVLRGVLVDPDPAQSRAFVQAGGGGDIGLPHWAGSAIGRTGGNQRRYHHPEDG